MKPRSVFMNSLIWGIMSITFLFTGCEKEKEPLTSESGPEETTKEAFRLKAAPANGTFYIINRNSGLALDLNTSSGNVTQWAYWGGPNQQWVLTSVGGGYYRVSPVSNTGIALDIASQSTENGANLQTYSYWGGQNQQFQFISTGGGYYRIVARNSGKSLDVYQSSTSNGANVIQWDYWGGNNQQWMLYSISGGSGGGANGQLSWVFTSTNIPQDARNRISTAMDAAVERYNYWANWPQRTLTVEYNTGVPTADANINGHIRFGSGIDYQNERTALHEICHTWGVGTSSSWSYPLIQNSDFVGSHAVAKIQEFDGPNAVINTGGSHFWPYGLNYNNEWSETNADRHVQIVWAMVQDGLY